MASGEIKTPFQNALKGYKKLGDKAKIKEIRNELRCIK